MDPSQDLLIFKKRAEQKPEDRIQVVEKPQPPPQQAPQQTAQQAQAPKQPERETKWQYKPEQQVRTQPKRQEVQQPQPTKIKPTVRMTDVAWPMYQPDVQASTELKLSNVSTKAPMSINESKKQAKGQFCVNHPWRHAYAVCTSCRLPYCYIDIMEQGGKLYCLNDIDSATKQQEFVEETPEVNVFSMMSSLMFVANSLVLGYFTYQQMEFIAITAMKVGVLSFFIHLNTSYYFTLANAAIIILGLASAITVLRKNAYGVGLSVLVSAGGLLVVLYEYLYSNVSYLFIACVLLILSLTLIAYSRMSSIKEVAGEESILVPDIDWPKPEAF